MTEPIVEEVEKVLFRTAGAELLEAVQQTRAHHGLTPAELSYVLAQVVLSVSAVGLLSERGELEEKS